MASLNLEQETTAFRNFYDSNRKLLVAAKNAYVRIIDTLIKQLSVDGVTKIEKGCIEKNPDTPPPVLPATALQRRAPFR